MSKLRRNWFPLLIVLCALVALTPFLYLYAQVSPQIQGSGAPANPCNNGGQQYVDQTNKVIYSCPFSGGNWVNIGLGSGTSSGFTNNGTQLTASQVILAPDGTNNAPAYAWAGEPNSGWYRPISGNFSFVVGGGAVMQISSSRVLVPILDINGNDTGLSRDATGIIDMGNGTQGDTSGKLKAAGMISVGSTFTASGCANSTLVGGATAGTYKSVTGGSCTVTITMGNSATSPNGWTCDAHDLTTVADANNVTMGSSNTTTANLVEGTVVANDIIAFKCVGY